MPKMPGTVRFSLALLSLIAAGWLGFSLLTIGNVIISIPSGAARWAIGGIALACSLVTAAAVYGLIRQIRMVYYATVCLLGMILLVSFMDELGWADLALISLTMITLGLLIKDRAWFLQKSSTDQ